MTEEDELLLALPVSRLAGVLPAAVRCAPGRDGGGRRTVGPGQRRHGPGGVSTEEVCETRLPKARETGPRLRPLEEGPMLTSDRTRDRRSPNCQTGPLPRTPPTRCPPSGTLSLYRDPCYGRCRRPYGHPRCGWCGPPMDDPLPGRHSGWTSAGPVRGGREDRSRRGSPGEVLLVVSPIPRAGNVPTRTDTVDEESRPLPSGPQRSTELVLQKRSGFRGRRVSGARVP